MTTTRTTSRLTVRIALAAMGAIALVTTVPVGPAAASPMMHPHAEMMGVHPMSNMMRGQGMSNMMDAPAMGRMHEQVMSRMMSH